MYQDGWWNDGQENFKELCQGYEVIKRNYTFDKLRIHWGTQTRRYHSTNTYLTNNEDAEMVNKMNEDMEDDCHVEWNSKTMKKRKKREAAMSCDPNYLNICSQRSIIND